MCHENIYTCMVSKITNLGHIETFYNAHGTNLRHYPPNKFKDFFIFNLPCKLLRGSKSLFFMLC